MDTSRPVSTSPDTPRHLYRLSLDAVAARLETAGFPRNIRTLTRWCHNGRLAAFKTETPNGEQWLVTEQSVDRAIGELQQLAAVQVMSGDDPTRVESHAPDMSGHAETRRAMSSTVERTTATSTEPVPAGQRPTMSDDAGHRAPAAARGDDTTVSRGVEPRPAASSSVSPNHVPPNHIPPNNTDAIFEHPYVKRLEREAEGFRTLYVEQVARTEAVQREAVQQADRARKDLIELAQATAVASSKTLAEYLLRAKELVLGAPAATEDMPGATTTRTFTDDK